MVGSKKNILSVDQPFNSETHLKMQNTVKPAHAITSIKQLPVLKGHPFLVL